MKPCKQCGRNRLTNLIYFNMNPMITNTVTLAKKQLEMHAQQGANSPLTVFEVARLLDMVRSTADNTEIAHQNNVVVGFSEN